jgi:hypothetical protein
MLLNSDSLDKTISFESVAGEKFNNLKFTEIFSASTVMSFKFDAPAKHTQYFPYLTDGTPDSYTAYKYAKFLYPDGTVLYMGMPWVRADSIVENDSPTRIITLPPTVTNDQFETIKSFLTTLNIDDYMVSVQ